MIILLISNKMITYHLTRVQTASHLLGRLKRLKLLCAETLI